MQRGTVNYRQWIGVLGQRLPDGVSEKRHVRRAGAALPRSLQPVHAPSTAAGLAALDKITDPLRRGGSPVLAADPGQPPQIRLGTQSLGGYGRCKSQRFPRRDERTQQQK